MATASSLGRTAGSLATLSKARLNALVVFTTGIGFVVGSPATVDWRRLGWTVLGTALVAASSAVLNQLAEHRRDAQMERTRGRPLATGAMRKVTAFVIGVVLAYAGGSVLVMWVDSRCTALAIGNVLLYVLVYTPLKPRTTLNTLVGAVCGAVPPMIGAVAAEGRFGTAAWVLGALLFVWQLPHFMALSWMYRADYARGGFVMLSVVETDGRTTALVAATTALCTVAVSLLAFPQRLAGGWYLIVALVMGAWLSWCGWKFLSQRSDAAARGLFFASVTYLPVVLLAMAIDRVART